MPGKKRRVPKGSDGNLEVTHPHGGMDQPPTDSGMQFDWMMDQFMSGGEEGSPGGDNLLHMILEEDEQEGNGGVTDGETDGEFGPETAGEATSGDESTPSVRPLSSHDPQQVSGDQSADQRAASPKPRRRKRLIDPFGELPPIKNLFVDDAPNDDEFQEGKKRKVRRFKCSQFEEPDKQLVWTLFRTSDRNNDGKLDRKEFGIVMNSPRLDLQLPKDDIRKLMSDICHGRDNIKECPMSFDEFFPFGIHLLKYFYSKKDVDSENHWVVLDKGFKNGVMYFNKETGQACTNRPTDYEAWRFKEPDIFEKALTDLFETADMNNDGKIDVKDFIRIINSADFGLQLTQEDADQITNHFFNETGKKIISMRYAFFLPMAKHLIVTVFRARDPTPHEWCHLYTSNVGSFWFNKRTGESTRQPPKKYITIQQERLVDRELEMALLSSTAEELDSTKKELEKETTLRKKLEERLKVLTRENNSNAKALDKTTKTLEKTKEENDKRAKQIESMERERDKTNTRIKGLENRAAEGDKAEQNLEALRDVLKSTQGTVREKDFEIRQLKSKLDETNKTLTETKDRVEELEAKVTDLHHQLRGEIKRNEAMEKELSVIPSLKKELSQTDEKVEAVQRILDEKKAQLMHARYTLRDNKQTIKTLEEEIDRLVAMETELEHSQCEVKSLKQLLAGKDRLVIQQCQQLANATGSRKSTESINFAIRTCTDPACPLYQSPKKSQSMQAGNGQFKKPSPRQSNMAFDDLSDEEEHLPNPNRRKPMTKAIDTNNKGFLRLLENGGNVDDMPMVYDLYEPNGSYSPRDKRSLSPTAMRGANRQRPKSCMARLRGKDKSALPKGTLLFEDDFMVAQFVHVGDRVRLKRNGVRSITMKPSDFLTGIVKFVGKIDQEPVDHRLYVGLRLDEPVGDTDGIINGKRYFHANKRHGKVANITDIILVLNAKTATYQRINEMVREHRHKTGMTRSYRDGDPELIQIP